MSMALNSYLATAQCERCNKSNIFSILVNWNGLTHTWTGIGVVLGLKVSSLGLCLIGYGLDSNSGLLADPNCNTDTQILYPEYSKT